MKNIHNRGFTLIEVAIILAIIGVIAGMGLPILNKYHTNHKISATKERMEQITYVLAGYVLAHGSLPCPSPSENNGISLPTCLLPNAAQGYLPFETLGIDENLSKDAFGKRFIYIREINLTAETNADHNFQNTFCAQTINNPADLHLKLTIMEEGQPKPVIIKDKDFMSMILISKGASKDPNDSSEREGMLTYIQRPFIESGHIFKWVTRNNLMAIYGKTPCNPTISAPEISSPSPIAPDPPSSNRYFRD